MSSYPDSQRKDWLSAETRDQVATGMSYNETAELPARDELVSQVVQHDGQESQDGGPGRGRPPSFSIAAR
eukprot:2697304-Pyramimonas_sp.AAC.1